MTDDVKFAVTRQVANNLKFVTLLCIKCDLAPSLLPANARGVSKYKETLKLNCISGSRDSKHLGQRMLAGITTAFIAVGLFQPTEVVKIRMQAQTTKAVESRLYSSSFQAYR